MRELFRRQPKFTPAVEPETTGVPNDLFFKCPQCKELNYAKEFREAGKVCQNCGYHASLSGRERLELLLDPDSFEEWDGGLRSEDPLGFVAGPPGKEETYRDKLSRAIGKTELSEAIISGAGRIKDWALVVVVADFGFMGASMGSVSGEKIARATERAIAQHLPLLTVSASGGARMQEGLLSLMQMAKTTAALSRLAAAQLPHFSLLVDPCYGGVTASYATTADIILAEPGTRIGFAGARVVEQTIRQKLPEGFQTAEFQLEHGMIDLVVPRRELRDTLATLLKLYTRAREWQPLAAQVAPERREANAVGGGAMTATKGEFATMGLDPWARVQLARHADRPHTLDYIGDLCTDFIELHGDRTFRDDPAIVGGVARLLGTGRTVVVIGHQKGANTKENLRRHFGMAHPEGFRKAKRLMRHAEKFRLPLITFLDIPGADPGIGSEERGQALAVAECIQTLTELRVPIVATVIGEGGSGGALALGVADHVIMLENATYSVITPEGCAAILWNDAKQAPAAAAAMRVTAADAFALDVIDEIIPEPIPAHEDPHAATAAVGRAIREALDRLEERFPLGDPAALDALLDARYAKFRAIGRWRDESVAVLNGA